VVLGKALLDRRVSCFIVPSTPCVLRPRVHNVVMCRFWCVNSGSARCACPQPVQISSRCRRWAVHLAPLAHCGLRHCLGCSAQSTTLAGTQCCSTLEICVPGGFAVPAHALTITGATAGEQEARSIGILSVVLGKALLDRRVSCFIVPSTPCVLRPRVHNIVMCRFWCVNAGSARCACPQPVQISSRRRRWAVHLAPLAHCGLGHCFVCSAESTTLAGTQC